MEPKNYHQVCDEHRDIVKYDCIDTDGCCRCAPDELCRWDKPSEPYHPCHLDVCDERNAQRDAALGDPRSSVNTHEPKVAGMSYEYARGYADGTRDAMSERGGG